MTCLRCIALVLLAAYVPIANAATTGSTPTSTIEHFYRAYMATPPTMKDPPLSQAFIAAKKENEENCIQHAGTDICGFAADIEPYLDTQEGGPLTYKSSGFTARELPHHVVEATFNVWPDLKDAKSRAYYTRHVFYKMIREHNAWVVDDIHYAGEPKWATQLMREENAAYRANPGPAPEPSH